MDGKAPPPFAGGKGEEKVFHVRAQKLAVFLVRTGMEEERNCLSCQPGSEVSSALFRGETPKWPPCSAWRCPGKPQSADAIILTPIVLVQSRAKNPHLVLGKVRRVKVMMRRACV